MKTILIGITKILLAGLIVVATFAVIDGYFSAPRVREGEELDVTVQVQEIALDGVYSPTRHYTASGYERIGEHTIILYHARDEFGKTFETVLIQNSSIIIEKSKVK